MTAETSPTTKERFLSGSFGLIFGGVFGFNCLWVFGDLLEWFHLSNGTFVTLLILGAVAGFVLGWKCLRLSTAVRILAGPTRLF